MSGAPEECEDGEHEGAGRGLGTEVEGGETAISKCDGERRIERTRYTSSETGGTNAPRGVGYNDGERWAIEG